MMRGGDKMANVPLRWIKCVCHYEFTTNYLKKCPECGTPIPREEIQNV